MRPARERKQRSSPGDCCVPMLATAGEAGTAPSVSGGRRLEAGARTVKSSLQTSATCRMME